MKNDDLDRLLKTWKPDLPDSPGFRRNVRERIAECKKRITFTQWVHETLDFMTRPVVGLPASALVIALSALLAVENGTSRREEIWSNLASLYHDSISPLNHPESK